MKKLGLAIAATSFALAMPASAATFVATGAGFSLPDGSNRSSSITVGNLGTITSISLTLNGFVHNWVNDFDSYLSISGGPTAQFMRDSYFSAATVNGNYTFTDGAPSFYGTSFGAIPSGTYSGRTDSGSTQNFGLFNGRSTAGTWVLNMSDQLSLNSGNLGSWTLTINYTPAVTPVPEPATWLMLILGFGAIGYGMRHQRAKLRFAAI